MSEDVRLEDVTAQNWRAVVKLKLTDEQKRLLASNVYSLAQSKFDLDACPRAIYAGDMLVGFMMYDLPRAGDNDPEASIYRFMIDSDHQGKGYGRAALARAIEEIRRHPHIRRITISYLPGNAVAKAFYASFGFVETGETGYGEMNAELAL